jgi:hypothetical protein
MRERFFMPRLRFKSYDKLKPSCSTTALPTSTAVTSSLVVVRGADRGAFLWTTGTTRRFIKKGQLPKPIGTRCYPMFRDDVQTPCGAFGWRWRVSSSAKTALWSPDAV